MVAVNRVIKNSTINGNRKYIVDIAGGLPVVLCEINDSNGSLTNSYFYADGQVLCQQNDSGYYYYVHDRLGSIRLVVNENGGIVNSYAYNPFGEDLANDCNETIYNPFKYTGQWYDNEIGQYYLRARMYDPALGRFTARDPIFGKNQEPLTLHKYMYCMNNPVNMTDPDGRFAWLAARLLIGATVGAFNAGGSSNWDVKATAFGAAMGAVSAILPPSFSSVVMSAGLSAASSSYSNYQKNGDWTRSMYSGFTAASSSMLFGGLTFGLGLRFDGSQNFMESVGLISFCYGESTSYLFSSYLNAPLDAWDNFGLEEYFKKKREQLEQLK